MDFLIDYASYGVLYLLVIWTINRSVGGEKMGWDQAVILLAIWPVCVALMAAFAVLDFIEHYLDDKEENEKLDI